MLIEARDAYLRISDQFIDDCDSLVDQALLTAISSFTTTKIAIELTTKNAY